MDKWLQTFKKNERIGENEPSTKGISQVFKNILTEKEKALSASPSNVEIISPCSPRKDVDVDSNSSNEGEKRKKKSHQSEKKMKFSDSWLKNPEFVKWLSRSKHSVSDMAYCKLCRIEIAPHKSNLVSHKNSARHQNKWKTAATNKKVEEVMVKDVVRAELKSCSFLAENNLPFSTMDSLVPLCRDIFPDSKIVKGVALKRTKATKIVESVGKCFKNDLLDELRKPGAFFSLIMDETTDISVKKQCAFTVIFYDEKEKKVTTRFTGMFQTNSGAAVDLYGCLKNILTNNEIPPENFVGFSSDTTNVMVGEHQSVFALLKNDNPYIVCTKCSCHSIHLATAKACLELPRSTEDLIRNIGSHFSRSACRQEKFKEFQSFFHTDDHKILQPSNTRWLSVEQCIDRVLEQYEPLKCYFTELLFDDPSHTTEQILLNLNNKYNLVYLEFLSYVLGLTNNFNLLFQSDKPLLHKLKFETEKLLKHLCSNFMDIAFIKGKDIMKIDHRDPGHFVNLNKLYLGVNASQTLSGLNKNDQNTDILLKSCLSFYLELVTQIKKRFDFSDSIYGIMSQVLGQSEQTSSQFTSLAPVVEIFPVLNNFINLQDLDEEWKSLMLDYDLKNDGDVESYLKNISDLKNAAGIQIFPNSAIVVKLLLVLPHSNVSVERIFSVLKLMRTDHRNRLLTTTINNLIYTKEGVKDKGGCIKFEPTQNMFKNIWKKD